MDLKRSMLSEEASLEGYVRGVIPSPASTGTPFVEHIIILHDSMYITVRQRQNYRKKRHSSVAAGGEDGERGWLQRSMRKYLGGFTVVPLEINIHPKEYI